MCDVMLYRPDMPDIPWKLDTGGSPAMDMDIVEAMLGGRLEAGGGWKPGGTGGTAHGDWLYLWMGRSERGGVNMVIEGVVCEGLTNMVIML